MVAPGRPQGPPLQRDFFTPSQALGNQAQAPVKPRKGRHNQGEFPRRNLFFRPAGAPANQRAFWTQGWEAVKKSKIANCRSLIFNSLEHAQSPVFEFFHSFWRPGLSSFGPPGLCPRVPVRSGACNKPRKNALTSTSTSRTPSAALSLTPMSRHEGSLV